MIVVLQWRLFTITFPSSWINQNVKPGSFNSPAKMKNSFSFSVCSLTPIPLNVNNIFVYPFISWSTSGLLSVVPIQKCTPTCLFRFSVLLGIHLGAELLTDMVKLPHHCEELLDYFPKQQHRLLCSHLHSWRLQLLWILASTCCCLSISAIPVHAKRYLFVLLICISLKMNDADTLSCTSWPPVHLF